MLLNLSMLNTRLLPLCSKRRDNGIGGKRTTKKEVGSGHIISFSYRNDTPRRLSSLLSPSRTGSQSRVDGRL